MKQAILKTVMCVGFLMLIAGCKPTVPSRWKIFFMIIIWLTPWLRPRATTLSIW